MQTKNTAVPKGTPLGIDLGENPVNAYQARVYAKESSPGIINVILELTENARDNATEVTLTIDVAEVREDKGRRVLIPKAIICEDNGTGLAHSEFLERFCGAYAESEAHHETDRAGRNGVGTKTYTSISDRVIVHTTTGRATDGLDQHRDAFSAVIPAGLELPRDGEPDTVWRVYDFRLHKRSALPAEWKKADPREMGTRVELHDLHPGTEIDYDVLIERLSYARDWLQNGAHRFGIQLTGNVLGGLGKRRLELKPWSLPIKTWLTEAKGRSDEQLKIFDPTSKETETISPAVLSGVLEFDFRVVGKDPDGQMQSLDKPALLLEICGALPYPPNLDGVQSTRTLPLLTFLGLEHVSSIGAFCNTVSGWARINSLELKAALRNNKTTFASGPGSEHVQAVREYLHSIFRILHRTWYGATRAGQDEAARDALKEATEEVNLALKGVNRNPFKGGEIKKEKRRDTKDAPPHPPARRHRWECGSCGKRWLANAGFTPKRCAEADRQSGKGDGCGSTSIGLAKNQPRIGDCEIRIEQLGDVRVPAVFQFEKRDGDDEDTPIVRVNLIGPRYVELRGTSSMSGQAQRRLKQYLVDVSLVAIAEYNARAKGTDLSEELGDLYFNRMLRLTGIREYESQVEKILGQTNGQSDQSAITGGKPLLTSEVAK